MTRILPVSHANGPRRVERLLFSCEVCGALFWLYPSQAKPNPDGSRRGRFCSRACQGRAKRTGDTLFCAFCDGSFYRAPAEQDGGSKVNQFCSRDCYMHWRVAHRKAGTYPKVGPVHVHRIVAAEVIGRDLLPDEVVHHIDLNKHNNAPDNLALFPNQATHVRCHFGSMSAEELLGFTLVSVAAREMAARS